MKTAIVIPNWNGADLLAECLKSLQDQSQKAFVIVVDNGSADDSVKIVEQGFPEVTLIKNSRNLGFAGGVNVGIRQALEHGAEAVALFNNDAFADKDWLEHLVRRLQRDGEVGIVTCKFMRHDKKRFDSTGDFFNKYGNAWPRGRNERDEGQYDTPGVVFGASGGASLYRASMLKDIGLFDERFFAYYEDVDISFRAQLAGWKVLYEPRSVAYHHVGGTSSKLGDFARYHGLKNLWFLYTKNMPGYLFFKYLPFFLYQFARSTASNIIRGSFKLYLRALWAYLRALPGVLRDRRRIQRGRKVPLAYIDGIISKTRPPRAPEL